MSDPYPIQQPPRRSGLERFLGGSPLGVVVRLVVLSLIVGFLLAMFGLRPQDLVDFAIDLFNNALRDGFSVFRDLGAYIVTGAILVVPIWLIIRLTKAR